MQGRNELTKILVHFLNHGSINGHHVIVSSLLLGREGIPRRNLIRSSLQPPLFVDQPHGFLPGEPLLPKSVPPFHVLTSVLGDGFFRSHTRKMRGDMGEIPEEWLLLGDGFIHELDSLLSPQVTSIPGRIELGIIAGNLLAVEEHFSAPFGSGLVREMQTSGR